MFITWMRLVFVRLDFDALMMNERRPSASVKISQMMLLSEYFTVLKTMPLEVISAMIVAFAKIQILLMAAQLHISFWS